MLEKMYLALILRLSLEIPEKDQRQKRLDPQKINLLMFPVQIGISITNANAGKSPNSLMVLVLGYMHIKKKKL